MGLKEDYERRKADQKSRDEQKQSLEGFGRKTWRHPDKIIRFAWWLAAFTFSLAAVTLLQSLAFIQSERAALYVNVENVTPLPFIADKPFAIELAYLNIGRAQAFMLEGKANAQVHKSLPEMPVFEATSSIMRGAVPAQGRRYFWTASMDRLLNWAEVAEIERGTLKLYIFGYAKYVDDFSIFGPRTVGFCGVYNPAGHSSIPGRIAIEECDNPNYVYNK
jgi:hypothetical protein